MFRALLASALLGLLLACSACGTSAGPRLVSSGYGQDALTLTRQIAGCSQPTRVRVAVRALSSSAVVGSCVLLRHRLYVFTWPDPSSEQTAVQLLRSGTPTVFASGVGWTAVVGDAASFAVQRQLAQATADALHGTVSSGS